MEDAKSATSAKLDMLDAICRDPRVSPGEFRVAYVLAQHRGPKGICPSLDLVSIQTGLRPRQIRNLMNGLVEKGWLRKVRRNRQDTNHYEFDTENVEPIQSLYLSKRDALAEERAARKSERQNIADQKGSEVQDFAGPERQRIAGPERQEIADKHLRGAPEEEPLEDSAGDEGEVLSPEVGLGASAAPMASAPRQDRFTTPVVISESLRASAVMQKRDPIASLNAMFGDDEAA